MKKLVLFLTSLMLVTILSCNNITSPDFGTPNSSFKGIIIFTDSTGINNINGSIEINQDNSNNLSGVWETDNGDKGKLIGTIKNSQIEINLNPDMIDNNIFLIGEYTENNITGTWQHVGIFGVDLFGTFKCIGL